MISLDSIRFIGHDLIRPECVLTHASGYLFASDWEGNGGISITSPDGHTIKHLARNPVHVLRPNGIALEPGGSFLLAHLGDESGGVFRLFPDGSTDAVVTAVDGVPLPPTNFVCYDERGRLWITVSTTLVPRSRDYRHSACTGFIALHDPATGSTRKVADGLGYTNECVLDTVGKRLLVNETFARRLAAYDLGDDGELTDYRVLTEFGRGCYPDGMAIDQQGHVLVVSIISNRLIRVAPDGAQTVLIEDTDADHLQWVENAWMTSALQRLHLDTIKSTRLKNISNIAFGGEQLTTACFGCLLGDSIATCTLSVAGVQPVYWDADIQPLLQAFQLPRLT